LATTPRDSAPDAVAETLAATPVDRAPDPALATLAVTDADVPSAAPSATRIAHDGSNLPIVSRDVYRIDGEIGRGGMGRVLRARDHRVGRAVAIKEVLTPSRELAVRFEREALITARLQHPSIIPVYECGRWPDGEPFYAMKLVAGKPLDQVIVGATDFPARAALLPHVVQVCEALAYAHDRGVIHRDLKPGNVLCGDYGETVVVDWGLAKDLATADAPVEDAPAPTAADVTRLGSAIGTPAYMAPEQARGEEVDARADVYALGAMLYHVLAGHPPYHRSKSAQDVIEAVIASTPPVPLGDEVPRELVAIVDRAMAASTDARYASAGELAADLRRFEAGQVVTAHRYTLGEMMRRWISRHRAAVLAAAAIVVSLVVVAVVMVRQVLQARDQARAQRAALLAESGRQELAAGAPARALPYLIEAWRAGRRDPTLRLTLAEAARTVDDVERVLVHDGYGVDSVALAADGSAATLGRDATVRLWRPDGTAGPSFELAPELLEPSLRLSDDGAVLAVLATDRVSLHDVATGARLGPELVDTGDEPSTPELSLGAGRAAVTIGGRARFYLVDGGRLIEQPARATAGDAVAMITRASGPVDVVLLPATEWPRAIAELRDPATGAVLESFALPEVVDARLHGGWLVAAATTDPPPTDPDNPDARLWLVTAIELSTGRRIVIPRVGWPPLQIAPLADGGLVLSDGAYLDRFDAAGQLIVPIERWARGRLIGVLSVGGRDVVVIDEDDELRLYDPTTGRTVGVIDGQAEATTTAQIGAGGARLITAGANGRAIVWRLTRRLLAAERGVSAVAPDGRWLRAAGATVAGDGVELAGHAGAVLAIAPAWGAARAATLGADHTARLWDLSGGRTLATIATDASAIALSPDGQRLATRAAEAIVVFDDAGRELASLRAGDADAALDGMAWSADGSRLLFWAPGARAWAWQDGAADATPSCEGAATAVRFAPSGGVAAIGTEGGTIVLCDVRTGTTIARLDGPPSPVTALAFSADGATLVSASGQTARLWSVASRRTIIEVDHGEAIGAVAVRDDSAVVATVSAPTSTPGSARPQLTLWDARTSAPLWRRASEGGSLRFVPGGVAVGGTDLVIWAAPDEARAVAALDAAAARAARWRLEAGGLVATVVVPAAPPHVTNKSYDFSEDVVFGGLFLPAIGPARPSSAAPDQEWLLAAWDMLAAGNPAAAASASATIDGDQLALPTERYALAHLRYLAGDGDGALRWLRAAIEAGGRDRPYLEALAVYLVQASVGGAAAVSELRAAGATGDQLLELTRQIADSGRDDDATAALDAVAATDASIVELATERYRIARAAGRLDRAVAAWLGALDQLPAAAIDRATLRSRIAMTAREFHSEYLKAGDPLLGDAARRLYAALLAVPDPEPFEERAELARYAAELDRMIADGGEAFQDLDKAMIRRVVRLRIRELQRCYEGALVSYPALSGTVRLQFAIDRHGRPRSIDAEGPAPLVACVKASAARWVFAASGAVVQVSHPFLFQTYDDVITPP